MKLDGTLFPGFVFVLIAVIVAFIVTFLSGCSRELVGWDPKTGGCQRFVNGKYVPPSLPKERCAGLEKPVTLPEGDA